MDEQNLIGIISESNIFIWNLDAITMLLPEDHALKQQVEFMLHYAVEKLLNGFNIGNTNLDIQNINDAVVDLSIVQARNYFNHVSYDFTTLPTIQFPGETSTSVVKPSADKLPNTQSDTNKLAKTCKGISNKFEQYKDPNKLPDFLLECEIDPSELYRHLEKLEVLDGSLIGYYKQSLAAVIKKSCVNVILCNKPQHGGIGGGFARLLVTRMGQYVNADNVFYFDKADIERFIDRLSIKYPNNCMLYISTHEEGKPAEREFLRCLSIKSIDELIKFRNIMIGSENQPILKLQRFVSEFN